MVLNLALFVHKPENALSNVFIASVGSVALEIPFSLSSSEILFEKHINHVTWIARASWIPSTVEKTETLCQWEHLSVEGTD